MLKQVQHDTLFASSATQLCGQSVVLFGWRPAEFWEATPAELECVLVAATASTASPPDAAALHILMQQFPDAPKGRD